MARIIGGVGSPLTYSLAGGSRVYGYTIGSVSATQVAPANPNRQRLVFHNPGDVDIFVAPVSLQTTGSDVAYTLTPAALAGAFRVYANGGSLTIEGECQKAWQAVAASGSDKPITVMDSNT